MVLKMGLVGLGIRRIEFPGHTGPSPVVSRGLPYVSQNGSDLLKAGGARLLCFDLRG